MLHTSPKKLIQFINLVRENKILYDYYDGTPNISVAQDEAWKNIASQLNEHVQSCKEKWRNIRSCYTRYLRQRFHNRIKKKQYYLAEHLEFLLPFCKQRKKVDGEPEDILSFKNDHEHLSFEELATNELKTEPPFETYNLDEAQNSCEEEESREESCSSFDYATNHLKRSFDPIKIIDTLPKKQKLEDDPDLAFFHSVLPDLKKMSDKQKNRFKIAVLKTVDDILYQDD